MTFIVMDAPLLMIIVILAFEVLVLAVAMMKVVLMLVEEISGKRLVPPTAEKNSLHASVAILEWRFYCNPAEAVVKLNHQIKMLVEGISKNTQGQFFT
jgi:hypothetical protein